MQVQWVDEASDSFEASNSKEVGFMEMISFSVDPQWCGLLFSIYWRHEKGFLLGGSTFPQHDAFAACSFTGPPADTDWIALAGSVGIEICRISSSWALIFDTGTQQCILYWKNNRVTHVSNTPSPFFAVKYFGANTLSPDKSSSDTIKRSKHVTHTSSSISDKLQQLLRDHVLSAGLSWPSTIESKSHLKKTANKDKYPVSKRKEENTKYLRFDSHGSGTDTYFDNQSTGISHTQDFFSLSLDPPQLARDEIFESLSCSRHITRNGSFDSASSEFSLDFSIPESLSDANIVNMEKIQKEIDSLNSKFLEMDEEIETIKSNRNLPGMSSLMEANTPRRKPLGINEDLPQDMEITETLKQQNARACFAGLYSLTTIKNSASSDLSDSLSTSIHKQGSVGSTESLVWDSPKILVSPLKVPLNNVPEDCYVEYTNDIEECIPLNDCSKNEITGSIESPLKENKITLEKSSKPKWPLTSSNSLTFDSTEADFMANLEWDEEGLVVYSEVDDATLGATENIVNPDSHLIPGGSATFEHLSRAVNNNNCGWLKSWKFASRLPYQRNNVLYGMKTCLQSLDNLISLLSSERNREEALVNILTCDPLLDLHIMEAVKLHMLHRAMELHQANSNGYDVPLFAVLMFSRDTSETPKDFMNNHLSEVGHSGGLEQLANALVVLSPTAEDGEIEVRISVGRRLLLQFPSNNFIRSQTDYLIGLRGFGTNDITVYEQIFIKNYTRPLFEFSLLWTPQTAPIWAVTNKIEMYLVGYTLGVTLTVVRPSAFGTDDFVCSYPDWNQGIWPQVFLVAEDDRHYNVLVE
uniref:Uncharacterized protein n=1 Tax=Timema monikensis TaxID=170555 RepID=A0A7R9E1S0_9NEOP|nr:unnamed protein product [Timema monikensis]